jgi:hypothetical protein
MTSLVYMLRSPMSTISRSLFLCNDPAITVLGIEGALTSVSQSQPTEVLQSGGVLPFRRGERLTYRQLLDVLITSGKVVTL